MAEAVAVGLAVAVLAAVVVVVVVALSGCQSAPLEVVEGLGRLER